jgi:hypothetical protein
MSGGDFDLNFLTEEICCYTQTFSITAYAWCKNFLKSAARF